MKHTCSKCLGLLFLSLFTFLFSPLWAQNPDPISDGVGAVIQVAGEVRTPADSVADTNDQQPPAAPIPVWKQKFYYAYNFDIYWHHDTKTNTKENGWSITLEPEIGWKLKERVYLGLRLGGSFPPENGHQI